MNSAVGKEGVAGFGVLCKRTCDLASHLWVSVYSTNKSIQHIPGCCDGCM